jgi:hypothetical protein
VYREEEEVDNGLMCLQEKNKTKHNRTQYFYFKIKKS